MKKTKLLWGMPITVEIVDEDVSKKDVDSVYEYFHYIDKVFSPYKKESEVTKINLHLISEKDYSDDIKTVLALCEDTKQKTNGHFDVYRYGKLDPSGFVKGWAINEAYKMLKKRGFKNFYIDAGGDIQVSGKNKEGHNWIIGIRNPFNRYENVKILKINEEGVATSGTYIRGQHIYNPFLPSQKLTDVVSFTVIGPNIYEADRFATAAFVMQEKGIYFIEKLKGFEGYMIDKFGISTSTSGFDKYVYDKKN